MTAIRQFLRDYHCWHGREISALACAALCVGAAAGLAVGVWVWW